MNRTDTRETKFPPPPLTMDEAAAALGISRRTLDEQVKRLPYFERRGNRRVFYPEHIEAMRKGLDRCACKSSGKTDGRMPTALPQTGRGSAALSELAILIGQKKRGRT